VQRQNGGKPMRPIGQKNRADFPRFGLPAYATRFPSHLDTRRVTVHIDQAHQFELDDAFAELPRGSMQTDFHCVTTWCYPDAQWGGVKLADFYKLHIEPRLKERNPNSGIIICAQDGYKTSMLLDDCLDESVMLVDTLDNQPLTIEHGAPLRLVAPKHYGYKNLKHLKRIEFHSTLPKLKRGLSAFLDHPRARVEKEERGRWVPGWLLRPIYRLLIPGTVKDFAKAMNDRHDTNNLG